MESIPFNLLTFPVWWYLSGFSLTLEWAKKSLLFTVKKSALRIFMRHFWDTLYGYHSRADRVLSFFLRIFIFIAKLLAICFKTLFLAVAILLYLALPPLLIGLIIYYI